MLARGEYSVASLRVSAVAGAWVEPMARPNPVHFWMALGTSKSSFVEMATGGTVQYGLVLMEVEGLVRNLEMGGPQLDLPISGGKVALQRSPCVSVIM